MSDFSNFLGVLRDKLKELAQTSWGEYKEAAIQDGRSFVDKTRADLERWTKLLATGELSKEDFAWLVKGKEDLAELEALKLAGLAAAQLDQFRHDLVDTVIGTAFEVFL